MMPENRHEIGGTKELNAQYFPYTGRETGLSSLLRLLHTLLGDRILTELPIYLHSVYLALAYLEIS